MTPESEHPDETVDLTETEAAPAEDAAASTADDNEATDLADAPAENDTDNDDDEDEAAVDDSEDDGEDAPAEEEEDGFALPLERVVEAVLFAAREPLKAQQIARCVKRGTRKQAVEEAIASLNAYYEEHGLAFEIVAVAERYQFMSRPEYAPHLRKLYGKKVGSEEEKDRKLSRAALDTLSIVAYKQPITRVEIETIRGVGCGPILRNLLERGSVRVVGKKAEVVGQPLLYGTTEAFLTEFGLGSLEELPMLADFRAATGSDPAIPSLPDTAEDGGEETAEDRDADKEDEDDALPEDEKVEEYEEDEDFDDDEEFEDDDDEDDEWDEED